MHINTGVTAGVLPKYPSGTNSTMWTECCEVAIRADERICASCKRNVIGYNAEKRRLADVEKAKQDEIARQEYEDEMNKAADEARAADINHANRIKAQARDSLMDVFHIDAEFAADIVAAIDAGKISNVMISY